MTNFTFISFVIIENAVKTTETGPFIFQSYNLPKHSIGIKHKNQGYIVQNSPHRFILVSPGLSGAKGSVSFESASSPGSYLRHSGFKIYLHPKENSKLYKQDATFYARKNKFFAVSQQNLTYCLVSPTKINYIYLIINF